MQNLRLRVFLVATMAVLSLGCALLPFAEADEIAPIEGGGSGSGWAEVCCGTGCSPGPYCYNVGSYTCCR
jgi:hypothetical protein